MKQRFYEELVRELGESKVLCGEPMREHTTFRVGGEAEYFLMPSSQEEVKAVLELFRQYQIPFLTMGNGSNLLVGDGGIEGAVLQIGRNLGRIRVEGSCLHAEAGALLSSAAGAAADQGLAGLEFAAGIPGSVGGAVTMNAGAYGGEMKQVVETVCAITPEGRIRNFSKEELEFGYRHSIVAEKGLIVLSAEFSLQKGNKEEILLQMKELSRRRREKQPLEYASAGSTFKRPEGHFAGKLIMDAGLAGFRIGGAQVSEKHCGFVVNTGGASAADIVGVMEHVQKTVIEKYSVMLEPEVKFAGRFD